MPACAEVNFAMQTLSGASYENSEQHKDSTKSRLKRDMNDIFKLLTALKQWGPFRSDKALRNLVSGVTANESVNVDQAELIGEGVVKSMVGKNVHDYSFRKTNQAITMGSKTAVTIGKELVQIEPQLLFQRLSIIASKEDDPAPALKYELCSYPPALFESAILPWLTLCGNL